MTAQLPLQALAPDGSYRPEALPEEYQPYLKQIDLDLLKRFYQEMSLVRAYDLEGSALQRQGQLALWVPCRGQEGAQVGAGFASRNQDYIFPAYREHAIAKVRGLDLIDIVRLYRGETHGGWDPTEHNFHIYTLVIGSQALHATGYAMGVTLDGKTGSGDKDKDEAVMAFFGDGATSQGDVSEAFVFAASYQAPVVFFLQNNAWAISVPVSVQSKIPLYLRSQGFGVPSVQIDGNDVIASYAASAYWLDQARAGNGPAFIEAVTYRMGAHTSSDDPTRYQDNEVFESWKDKDPIQRLEKYLRAQGVSDDFFDSISEEAKAFALDIRTRALSLTAPVQKNIFANVYAEPHPVTQEQNAWLDSYEAALGEEL